MLVLASRSDGDSTHRFFKALLRLDKSLPLHELFLSQVASLIDAEDHSGAGVRSIELVDGLLVLLPNLKAVAHLFH